MLTVLVPIWGLINLFLALLAFVKIKKKVTECDFIWPWAFLTGAFVWEDLFVFGLLHAGIALVAFLLNNNNIWLVGFIMFWIVRSAGETLYFFLQQFIVPTHHPHYISEHFNMLRSVFGNISDQKCFIIMQVFLQSVLVTSLLLLIFVVKSM